MLGKKTFIHDKNNDNEMYGKSICEWKLMKDENACEFK